MNSVVRQSARSLGAFILTALSLVFIVIMVTSNATHAVTSNNSAQNGRVVTIHDRGQDTVIITQADTVGDALKEAGIIVDVRDAVEPDINTQLVASDYQVNIYRARPVIIIDGNVRTRVITPYQTAEAIAKIAGIKLYEEDITSIDRTDDIVAEGAGLKLTITRATPFEFTLYGNTNTVRTQSKTVGDMLMEKDIKLGKDDKITPSLDTEITAGLSVRLWREGRQTITVSEPVSFDTEKIEDADQSTGYVSVQTPGKSGKRNVTYEIVIQDGREVSRKEIASLTLVQPQKQIEVVGIKGEYTTPSENENIIWDFLINHGFSKIQSAGIMGNLMQEHGFDTSDSVGGYGLVQWMGERRNELISMPYPENIYTQLNFMMSELNNNYTGVSDAIKSSTTIEDATRIFQNQYEKCGICMEGLRIQYAQNALASHL